MLFLLPREKSCLEIVRNYNFRELVPSVLNFLEWNFIQKYARSLELPKKKKLIWVFGGINRKNCVLLFALYQEKDPLLSTLK